jgi:hypothetical protein
MILAVFAVVAIAVHQQADNSNGKVVANSPESRPVASIAQDPLFTEDQPEEETQSPELASSEKPDTDYEWARPFMTEEEILWLRVSFDERQRRFQLENRDLEWAAPMERAISEEIGSWLDPPVQLLSAECRTTMCKIAMYWPPDPSMQAMGQQISYLRALGLDHQGPAHGVPEGNGYLDIVIARRR